MVQDFICLFFGDRYILTNMIALSLSIYVFVVLNSSVNLSTQNAIGAHRIDSKEIMCQALLLVFLQIIIGRLWGEIGITIGMIIPVIIFSGIIKGMKIFRVIFHKEWSSHVRLLVVESVGFICVGFISLFFYRMFLNPSSILAFMLSAVVMFVFSNAIFIIINFNSKHMKIIKMFAARITADNNRI